MSSANVSPSFYTQFDVMKIADDIHIHSQRLHFSVHTMAKQCLPSQISCFEYKILLNVGKEINLILATCSLKLKSSNAYVLIYIIFTMGGKLLFSTNSDIYYFSFLVICFLHHIATIVVVIIGINSFRHRFVLSFILSIPHGMFLTLYTDTTVLLSRMIRYSVVPHCTAH